MVLCSWLPRTFWTHWHYNLHRKHTPAHVGEYSASCSHIPVFSAWLHARLGIWHNCTLCIIIKKKKLNLLWKETSYNNYTSNLWQPLSQQQKETQVKGNLSEKKKTPGYVSSLLSIFNWNVLCHNFITPRCSPTWTTGSSVRHHLYVFLLRIMFQNTSTASSKLQSN